MKTLEELELPSPGEGPPTSQSVRLLYVVLAVLGLQLLLVVVCFVRVELEAATTQSALVKLGKRFPALDVADALQEISKENKHLTAELTESQAEVVKMRQRIDELDAQLKAQEGASAADASTAQPKKILSDATDSSQRPVKNFVAAIKSAVPYE